MSKIDKYNKESGEFYHDIKPTIPLFSDWTKDSPKIKIFKKKRHLIKSFEYIPKKDFEKRVEEYNEKVPEREQINIVGNFKHWRRIRKKKREKNEKIIGVVRVLASDRQKKKDGEISKDFHLFKPESARIRTKGYAYLGKNRFVRVERRLSLLIILIPLLLLLLFCGIFYCNNDNDRDDDGGIDIEDAVDYSDDETGAADDAIVEYTEIPGFVDKTYTDLDRVIKLYNPKGNTVYFQYLLYENDEVIFETDWIAPNKMVEYNIYENLSSGSHDIKIVINTCDIDTYAVCSGANQEITVSVEK